MEQRNLWPPHGDAARDRSRIEHVVGCIAFEGAKACAEDDTRFADEPGPRLGLVNRDDKRVPETRDRLFENAPVVGTSRLDFRADQPNELVVRLSVGWERIWRKPPGCRIVGRPPNRVDENAELAKKPSLILTESYPDAETTRAIWDQAKATAQAFSRVAQRPW